MKASLMCALLRQSIYASVGSTGGWLTRAMMMAFNNWIWFVMWLIIYRHTSTIGGWTLNQVMLLFGITATVYGLSFGIFGGFTNIPDLVRTGKLNVYLCRPQSPLLLVLTSKGEASAWGDVLSGLVFILFSGARSTTGWLYLPLIFFFATLVVLSASLVYFSISFWVPKSETLSFQLWETLMTFSLYPESIFPPVLKLLLFTVFPAAFTSFIPVKILGAPSIPYVVVLIAASIAWCVAARLVFRAGIARFVRG